MFVAKHPDGPGEFDTINSAYQSVFQPDRLSIGLVVPIAAYPSSAVPTMTDHIERVTLA